jgi:hypothetical protein
LERLLGPVLTIVSVIGVFFGFLAAILAYVILYGEYTHVRRYVSCVCRSLHCLWLRHAVLWNLLAKVFK